VIAVQTGLSSGFPTPASIAATDSCADLTTKKIIVGANAIDRSALLQVVGGQAEYLMQIEIAHAVKPLNRAAFTWAIAAAATTNAVDLEAIDRRRVMHVDGIGAEE